MNSVFFQTNFFDNKMLISQLWQVNDCEICLNSWLKSCQIYIFQWNLDEFMKIQVIMIEMRSSATHSLIPFHVFSFTRLLMMYRAISKKKIRLASNENAWKTPSEIKVLSSFFVAFLKFMWKRFSCFNMIMLMLMMMKSQVVGFWQSDKI